MARTVSEELVCDECGTTARVEAFTIVTRDGAAVVDLCPGDAKPLVRLYALGSTEPRRRKDRRAASGHAVMPVD